MKKSILSFLMSFYIFVNITLCTGQVMFGYTEFIGVPLGLQPHEITDKPFIGGYYMLGYRKEKFILETEFHYFLVSETEYNNKKDKTAFAWYGVGIQRPFITSNNSPTLFRTFYGASLVLKEIYEDYYVDALSLNLQSGYRLGFNLKILLEFNESDRFYPCFGMMVHHDIWAFGVKDRTNVKLWSYGGVYFAVRINMSEMFKGILN